MSSDYDSLKRNGFLKQRKMVGRRGFKLYVGGKVGRKPRLGQVLINYLEPGEVVSTIQKVLDVFAELAQKGEGIANVVDRISLDKFKQHIV